MDLYHKHVKQLRTIQQRHLRSILSIKWDHFVSNEVVLERANSWMWEIKLLKNRLRWMGHICRMNDTRPVKALLFGELEGSRKVGRSRYVTRTRAKWLCSVVNLYMNGTL